MFIHMSVKFHISVMLIALWCLEASYPSTEPFVFQVWQAHSASFKGRKN